MGVSKDGTFRVLNLGAELSFRCEIEMVLNAPGNLEFIKLQQLHHELAAS